MKITKEEALNMLDRWLETAANFPRHELVFKTINTELDIESIENFFNEYTFRYLLSIAYDLQPKQDL